MRKLLCLLLMHVLCINFLFAQAPQYAFTAGTDAFVENGGSATLLPTLRVNSAISAALPIGFTFNYGGTNYTQFRMSSSGFITFNPTTSTNVVSNNLSTANADLRPIIAPLWDDLDGSGPASSQASYLLSGTVGSRVLTIEWKNWEWNFQSATPVISFQVKLFETSNVIMFAYRSEATSPTNSTASIGISNATGSGNESFLNVMGDAIPMVSSSIVFSNISVRPGNNVIYTFTPNTCLHPAGFTSSNITAQTATITWTADSPAAAGYQYIVQPASATVLSAATSVTTNTANITGLVANTVYNVYLRKNCGNSVFSGWVLAGRFTTPCIAVTEISETFDSFSTPGFGDFTSLPPCWSRSNSPGQVSLSGTENPTPSGSIFSAPNCLRIRAFSSSPAVAVLPPVSNLQANTHRLTFKTYAWSENRTMDVGYLTNVGDISTFVVIQTLNLASTSEINATVQTIVPTGIPAGINNLALRVAGASFGAFVDDLKWEVNSTCIAPTALIATEFTTTSAQIDWNEPVVPAANGYEIFWSTSATTPPLSATPMGTINAGLNSFTITGLQPSTLYYVWVRSRCSATARSSWSSILSFATNCPAVTSFTQNFDVSTNLPSCWTRLGTGGSLAVSSISSVSTPNSLSINSSNIFSLGIVVLPPVSNIGAGTHRLLFSARSINAITGQTIEVGYVTNNSNPASFISVQSFVINSGTVWADFIATLGTTPVANSFLAIRHSGAVGVEVLIDNVSWEPIPDCFVPTAPVASAITNTSATVSWTAPTVAPANGYQYFISTSNMAPNAASAATGSTAAGITTFNFTGLTANTQYFVWIRSVCSATSSSVWTTAFSFRTLCNVQTTLPWFENFDTTAVGTNVFPSCWNFANITGNWLISTTPAPAYSGANQLRRTSSTNGWAFTSLLSLTAGTSYEFSYWVRTNDATLPGYTIEAAVGTSQTVAAMTTILDTRTSYISATWNKVIVNFTPNTTGAYTFGLRAETTSALPQGINFDDFKVQLTPSCSAPTALVASAITVSSATASWTAPTTAPANGYQYFISTSNTAPNAASTVTGSTGAGVTTFNFSSLLASTNYYVWVRSVCSATATSDWSNMLSFTTACGAVSVPYVEDFQSAAPPNMPFCTSAVNAGLGNNWITANNPGFGFTSRTLTYNYNANNPANAWFFSKGVNLTAGVQYKLNYRYGARSTSFTEKLKVAYGTTATVAGMTTQLADHPNIVTNSPITAPQVNFTPSTTGVYYFGFNAYSVTDQWDLYVDDIVVDTFLSNSTFDNENFTYYPNPVKDILNLGYSQSITNVSVYNLLGQEVITKNVNANQSKIDMSGLNAGTYLVKVTADNQTKTIKVIKE